MRKQADNYYDVAELWQMATEKGRLRYRVRSHGQAVSLRQRAYKWRKRQLELTADRLGEIPGIPPTTPYDVFTISIRDPDDNYIPPGQKGTPPGEYFDLVFYIREAGGVVIEEED